MRNQPGQPQFYRNATGGGSPQVIAGLPVPEAPDGRLLVLYLVEHFTGWYPLRTVEVAPYLARFCLISQGEAITRQPVLVEEALRSGWWNTGGKTSTSAKPVAKPEPITENQPPLWEGPL